MRTAISFIIIFNIMVFVHEFGHFYFARRNGIKVHEFSLGMGPAILKKQSGDTLYALRALPIGGYVKMEGEDSESKEPDSFNTKTPWQRFQVIVAGAVNNIILAFIAMLLAHLLAGGTVASTTIGSILDDSPAETVGLMVGDRIERINGENIGIFMEANMAITQSSGTITMEILRDGTPMTIDVEPMIDEETNARLIGIRPLVQSGFANVATYTLREMFFFTETVFEFIGKAFQGRASTSEISGPVGLVQIVGETAQTGWVNVLFLLGVLSLNLGVFNLLPIPALDGGRLLFILIELVRGKPLPPEREGLIHGIGFALLMLLIGFVTYNDIVKLF